MWALNLALILACDMIHSVHSKNQPTISDTKARGKQFYLEKLFPVRCHGQYPHNRHGVSLIAIFYLVIE